MSSQVTTHLTEEQYLEIERKAQFRSEYHGGRMFAMAGGSPSHSLVASNLLGLIFVELRGRACFIYGSDMRLYVPATKLYTYPDLSVVCGEARFAHGDCLLNPSFVAEVLSPSTEAYDRGKKFEDYQSVESLREYLLLSQDRARADLLTRQAGGAWMLRSATGLDGVIAIESLGCRIALRDLYARVDLSASR